MTKKGVVWIVVYGLLNLAVYLLTLNSIYSLISVSLSTMLIGIIVKFYPKHIGIKFKDKTSFFVMIAVSLNCLLLAIMRLA